MFVNLLLQEPSDAGRLVDTGTAHAAVIAPKLAGYLAHDPALREQFTWLRRHAAGMVGNNCCVYNGYDLWCGGYLYFAGSDQDEDGAVWATLFAAEKRRGVNFAYSVGGEPVPAVCGDL